MNRLNKYMSEMNSSIEIKTYNTENLNKSQIMKVCFLLRSSFSSTSLITVYDLSTLYKRLWANVICIQQHTTATSRIGENIHMPPSTFCQHSNMPKIATTLLDIHPACKLLHNFQYPPARYSTWKHCPCLFLSPS